MDVTIGLQIRHKPNWRTDLCVSVLEFDEPS